MEILHKTVGILGRIVRSRPFAAAALMTVSAVMIVAVSVNMRAVTVNDGEDSRVILTFYENPHAVLAEAGVVLSEGDSVESVPEGDRAASINITRAFDVQVTADGVTTLVRMTDGTVADALEKVGVEVGEQDELSVPADTALAEGIEIEVGRVTYREYTKTETIPFETTIKYTNIIAKGATKVSRKGQTGVKTYTYRERIVNGEVAQTTLVSEKVTKAAVDQVNLVGTVAGVPLSKAPYEIELDEKGHPVNYKTVYTGKATAYTNEGGRLSKYTASGRLAQVGVVGVDPRKIPYGTELYIVSPSGSYVYGYAIAGDTGPGVRNGSLITDVFMDTVEECRQFGGRTMMVYVLK